MMLQNKEENKMNEIYVAKKNINFKYVITEEKYNFIQLTQIGDDGKVMDGFNVLVTKNELDTKYTSIEQIEKMIAARNSQLNESVLIETDDGRDVFIKKGDER
jgi:hypothetical protein